MVVAFGALPGILFAALVSGVLVVAACATGGEPSSFVIALLFVAAPCATALGCGIAAALRGGGDAELPITRNGRSARGPGSASLA